jgi:Flp pilus assembly protein TadG
MTQGQSRVQSLRKKLLFRDSGQALVETALTLPLLVLILIGAAEFARIAYAAIEVSNAARAGAAYGASSIAAAADSSGIQTAAALDAGDLTSTLTTTATTSGICSSGNSCTGANSTCSNTDCSTPGDHIETVVTVKTSVTFDPLIHLPGIPTTFTLKGQAVQKCLQ